MSAPAKKPAAGKPTASKKPKPDRPKRPRADLTAREKRFVAEYVASNNATAAARAAGYAESCAMQYGTRLTKKANVAAAIEAARSRTLQRLQVKADDVLAELAKVAFDAELSAFKVRALELLGKHHQLFVERVDLRVDAMKPEERAARAAALLATARDRLLGSGDGGGDE